MTSEDCEENYACADPLQQKAINGIQSHNMSHLQLILRQLLLKRTMIDDHIFQHKAVLIMTWIVVQQVVIKRNIARFR